MSDAETSATPSRAMPYGFPAESEPARAGPPTPKPNWHQPSQTVAQALAENKKWKERLRQPVQTDVAGARARLQEAEAALTLAIRDEQAAVADAVRATAKLASVKERLTARVARLEEEVLDVEDEAAADSLTALRVAEGKKLQHVTAELLERQSRSAAAAGAVAMARDRVQIAVGAVMAELAGELAEGIATDEDALRIRKERLASYRNTWITFLGASAPLRVPVSGRLREVLDGEPANKTTATDPAATASWRALGERLLDDPSATLADVPEDEPAAEPPGIAPATTALWNKLQAEAREKQAAKEPAGDGRRIA